MTEAPPENTITIWSVGRIFQIKGPDGPLVALGASLCAVTGSPPTVLQWMVRREDSYRCRESPGEPARIVYTGIRNSRWHRSGDPSKWNDLYPLTGWVELDECDEFPPEIWAKVNGQSRSIGQ